MRTSRWRGSFPRYKRSYGLLAFRSRDFTKRAATRWWNSPICGFDKFGVTNPRRSPIRCAFPPMERCSAKAGSDAEGLIPRGVNDDVAVVAGAHAFGAHAW